MTNRIELLSSSTSWLWYKTAVPVFLERFVLAICAAAIVALLINPLNFDKTQRITLGLGIIFFAYFAAHTIYKTPAKQAPANDASKEVDVLRSELESARSKNSGLDRQLEKQQEALRQKDNEIASLRKDAESKAVQLDERAKRKAIKEEIGKFLSEAETIRQRCLTQTNLPAPQEEANNWATKVNKYLLQYLDSSFSSRFVNSPPPLPLSHANVPESHDGLWRGITAKMQVLSGFLSELRD